jgi:glycosyltransferase involved in cell wall biosynthesis
MLVSIIVPVYNAKKYIQHCVDSLIRQDYSNIEIILIDDCSNDGTYDLLKKIKEKDDRIILLQNKRNMGASYSRNRGIKISRGDYITFVDADDSIESNTISSIMSWIEKEGHVDFVRYNFKTKNPLYNNNLGALKNKKIDAKAKQEEIMDAFFLQQNRIPTYVWLLFINKRIVKKLSFKTTMSYMEDTAFYMRLFELSSTGAFLDIRKYKYEDNGVSVTRNIKNTKKRTLDMLHVCELFSRTKMLDTNDKKTAISNILNLMTAQLMILEIKDRKEYKKLISDKELLERIKSISIDIDNKTIGAVKRLYIQRLTSHFPKTTYMFIPVAKIKYGKRK